MSNIWLAKRSSKNAVIEFTLDNHFTAEVKVISRALRDVYLETSDSRFKDWFLKKSFYSQPLTIAELKVTDKGKLVEYWGIPFLNNFSYGHVGGSLVAPWFIAFDSYIKTINSKYFKF